MLPGLSSPGKVPPPYPRPEGGRSSPKDIPFVADLLVVAQTSFALPGEKAFEQPARGLREPGTLFATLCGSCYGLFHKGRNFV